MQNMYLFVKAAKYTSRKPFFNWQLPDYLSRAQPEAAYVQWDFRHNPRDLAFSVILFCFVLFFVSFVVVVAVVVVVLMLFLFLSFFFLAILEDKRPTVAGSNFDIWTLGNTSPWRQQICEPLGHFARALHSVWPDRLLREQTNSDVIIGQSRCW